MASAKSWLQQFLWHFALLLLVFLCFFPTSTARAQISFVQITDPHVFDDQEDNLLNNWLALASCIDKINQEVTEGRAEYKFVVMTGDLGVEKLVSGTTEQNEIASRLDRGAARLVSQLSMAKVRHWLFVPGNNDVLNEESQNIRYYHAFIEALIRIAKRDAPDLVIDDLCPRGEPGPDGSYRSRSAAVKLDKDDKYTFIGFDDSTFKNSEEERNDAGGTGKGARIERNASLQSDYVRQVGALLSRSDITYAYIFHHVPEIDDPYLLTLKPDEKPLQIRHNVTDQLGGAYLHSAWFVNTQVRIDWNAVVMNSKVKGFFAGHFHDNRKTIYETLDWVTADYFPEELSKLHVCPPLALRFQDGKDEQARGFQEVYLDEVGNVSTRILWFDHGSWNLTAALQAKEKAAAWQLELGRTYESLNRWPEAEAAYAKAGESDWPPTHNRALASLTRLIREEDSYRNKHFFAPLGSAWNTGLSALGATLPAIVLIILLTPVAVPLCRLVGRWRGRNKVRIGPTIDAENASAGVRFDQIAGLVLERIQTHFRPRGLIKSDLRLPLLARSQSPEVENLLEAIVPPEINRFFAWLRKLSNRPRYSIQGVISSTAGRRQLIFLSLHDGSKRLETWSIISALGSIVEDEKRLAFSTLKRLIRYMNQ